jgi:hypothetical protein
VEDVFVLNDLVLCSGTSVAVGMSDLPDPYQGLIIEGGETDQQFLWLRHDDNTNYISFGIRIDLYSSKEIIYWYQLIIDYGNIIGPSRVVWHGSSQGLSPWSF